MEFLIALFFGIVQGATEFLPISTGGHLAMIQNFNQTIFGEALFSPTLTFDILLRLGTLLAIIFVFFSDIKKLWRELWSCVREIFSKQFTFRTERPYRKLLYMLFVTTLFLIPALFLSNLTTAYLSGLSVIAFTLVITGVVGFLIDRVGSHRTSIFDSSDLEPENLKESSAPLESAEITEEAQVTAVEIPDAAGEISGKKRGYLKKAMLVGIFQFCSIIPGLSRNAFTILGGLVAGFRRDVAVKYAFLATIPVLIAKILLQLVTVLQDGILMNWIPYLSGMIAAFVSGVFSIGLMRKAVRKGYCKRFGIYCCFLAIIIFVIQLRG